MVQIQKIILILMAVIAVGSKKTAKVSWVFMLCFSY